jgi:hypothetical protein
MNSVRSLAEVRLSQTRKSWIKIFEGGDFAHPSGNDLRSLGSCRGLSILEIIMSKHKGPKFRTRFQNLLFLSERGGVWKTTTASLVIDIAINSGAAPLVFEIDDQRLLIELFPDRTRLVQVPSTEDMLESDQADIAAFGPVFEAMTSSDTTQIVGCGSKFRRSLH